MLPRSVRSSCTASTLAPGCSALHHHCAVITLQAKHPYIYMGLWTHAHFSLSLAACPLVMSRHASTVTYPWEARALAVSNPMPVLAPASRSV